MISGKWYIGIAVVGGAIVLALIVVLISYLTRMRNSSLAAARVGVNSSASSQDPNEPFADLAPYYVNEHGTTVVAPATVLATSTSGRSHVRNGHMHGAYFPEAQPINYPFGATSEDGCASSQTRGDAAEVYGSANYIRRDVAGTEEELEGNEKKTDAEEESL